MKRGSKNLSWVTCKAGRVDDDPFHREGGVVKDVLLQEQPDLSGVVSERAARHHGKWSSQQPAAAGVCILSFFLILLSFTSCRFGLCISNNS